MAEQKDTLAEQQERSWQEYTLEDIRRLASLQANIDGRVALKLLAVVEAAKVIRGVWYFDPEDEEVAAFDAALAALDGREEGGGR